MAIYEKSVRLLIKDMVNAFNLQNDQIFTRQEVIDWFAKNYPKIKKGTVNAHLTTLSINAQSRFHYKAKPKDDDLFFQVDSSRFRLYDSKLYFV